MTLLLEKKYLKFLAPHLRNYKEKSRGVVNFSCPICGDSSDKKKARGYVIERSGRLSYYCHNCSYSNSFVKFLRYINPALYRDYLMEMVVDKNKDEDFEDFKTPRVYQKAKYDALPCVPVTKLPSSHYARKYLLSRKVPLDEFYYTECFKTTLKKLYPDHEKIDDLYDNDDRVVVALRARDGSIIGMNGRTISERSKAVRYMTVKGNEEDPKIFRMDKVDFSKPIPVLEGVFDALLLDNAVAMLDSGLHQAPMIMGHENDYIMVYDNEPRNKDIVRNMNRSIELGQRLCIFPLKYEGIKDINDMVLKGFNRSEIQYDIEQNSFTGMKAKVKLSEWKK